MIRKLKFLILFPLLFLSCEKEYCWDCTTEIYYEADGYLPSSDISTTIKCDISDEDIRMYEEMKTYKVTIKTGVREASVEYITKCKRR